LSGSPIGSGSGTVTFTTTNNIGSAPRSGAIAVAGQWLPFLQKPSSPVSSYTDEPATDSFYDYVNFVGLNHIATGCLTPLTYCPADTMVRAEMAAFVIRSLYGEVFTYSATPYFTDVPSAHPKFAYVQKMMDLGITTGCGVNLFCPDGPLSREQMAVFIVRARLGLKATDLFPYPGTPYFTDMPANSVYFPFVQKLREMGITAGCSATTYCGGDPNSRGQMAVFVTRGFF
jgi:Fe2+ transport system protein FeoA